MVPSIRRATVADSNTISALVDELNKHFGVEEPAFPGSVIEPYMQGEDPLIFGYLAETDGKAVGYALCQKFFDTDTGTMATWMLDLYIRPDNRGNGLGRQMIAHVAADAKAKGQRCISLAVYHGNPARRLYDRIGAALPEDAIVYELRDENLDKLALEVSE